MIRQSKSMLDLVRRTGGQGSSVRTDLDDILNALPPLFEVEYDEQEQETEKVFIGDEFRYVNVPPTRLAHMVEVEDDAENKASMERALRFWRGQGDPGIQAGEPYRGEQRQAIMATSMRELVSAVKPVSHVMVGSFLRAGGISTKGEPTKPGEYVDMGIIDWDFLLSMGPLPETEDWF